MFLIPYVKGMLEAYIRVVLCPSPPLGYVGVKPLFLLRSWWEIVLNDYSKGALEALAWVQQLVKDLKRDPDG